MVLLYLLYNVAIELNYVNVLTEEMSFIFYDGQKEESIIIECRILKCSHCWELLPATCDTVIFVTNLNMPTHWQKRAFKLVNDFALMQKTCVCFVYDPLVAYLWTVLYCKALVKQIQEDFPNVQMALMTFE